MTNITKKIVVVEDEPLVLKVINIELLEAGFAVECAMDGAAGIHLIQKVKPDLVLLDLVLPKLSGYEVLRQMRENESTKKIPVIILSNLGQKEELTRGFELGAEDYFIKTNTDLRQIVEKIKELLK